MVLGKNEQKRREKDFLGEVEIPANAYWGASTQRAIRNFQISGKKFPDAFILALAKVKKACLKANYELGKLDKVKTEALLRAIDEILSKKLLDQFPLDVFQTGSGTQTNMNMNEVVANRANEILGHPLGRKSPVHPNDDVNKSQSSNDVIPTAMHLCAIELLNCKLFPSLDMLKKSLRQKTREFKGVIKTGRTHLQDAVPIPLSMEFEVYERQVSVNEKRLRDARNELYFVPLGGTALGTGTGADRRFAKRAVSYLRDITGVPFRLNPVKAEGIASHSAIVNTSAALRLLSLSLLKMANDIRWMGSGPRAGLGELVLPANEQGSSIMPGKVNPTQSEMLIQVCLQVIGNDTAISFAEGFGSILDLNVTKPLMFMNLHDSIVLLSKGIDSFVKNCLKGLKANKKQIDSQLKKSLVTVTNLAPLVGYDLASEIARKADRSGKTVKEVVKSMCLKIKGDLDRLLDPKNMT